jgi:hypothetical protein
MEQVVKYWFDTEFNDEVDPVQLISIGIVAEDGREMYSVLSSDSVYHPKKLCNKFVNDRVMPQLFSSFIPGVETAPIRTEHELRAMILDFLDGDERPEFWGYYADYDWYLFTRLFGTFQTMPKKFPFLCLDLKQYALSLGVSVLPKPLAPEHHALIDARWTKLAWDYVSNHEARI